MKVLITGAAHGLGRAMADQLLAEGHEVVAVDRDIDTLDTLAIGSRNACTPRICDLSNPASVDRLLSSLITEKFDLVVLNAGISATGKFEDIPSAAYSRLIAVNLESPLVMAASLVGQGNMNPKSKIVFISSLSHAVGYPGASVYGATKDAIATYAKSVRKPFKKQGVSVLTVFPGPIKTAHAEKHAPPGAKADKRMEPADLAARILKAAKGKSKELYPGTAAELARMLGALAPNLATSIMRKQIYDKIDKSEY